MPRHDFVAEVKAYNAELKTALQTVFDELNKGQTQKVLKNEQLTALVEKFHIEHK